MYVAGYLVTRQLVLTLYKINKQPPRYLHPVLQVSINSQQRFHGLSNLELYAEPIILPRTMV
jgi:hypothetical protein